MDQSLDWLNVAAVIGSERVLLVWMEVERLLEMRRRRNSVLMLAAEVMKLSEEKLGELMLKKAEAR